MDQYSLGSIIENYTGTKWMLCLVVTVCSVQCGGTTGMFCGELKRKLFGYIQVGIDLTRDGPMPHKQQGCGIPQVALGELQCIL